MILKDWELRTIEALAQEAFERESDRTEIRHPDLWLDKAIRDRQADAISSERYRLQLVKHAERLGIGNQHPKRVTADDPLDYVIASKDISSRWCRIIGIVLSTEREHPWRQLHYELVTIPVLEHLHDKDPWGYPDEGIPILELLEREAEHHGLINDEPAPPVDTQSLAERLLATLGG